jgi:DNA repair protein RadC
MNEIKTEEQTPYQPIPSVDRMTDKDREDMIIVQAIEILESRLRKPLSMSLNNARVVEDYFRLKLRSEIIEQFWVLGLDTRNRMVTMIKICEGTTNAATIYPRQIVRTLIDTTVTGVVLIHNHPSGSAVASKEDIAITDQIKKALKTIDIIVHDHIIIADTTVSFANSGLL